MTVADSTRRRIALSAPELSWTIAVDGHASSWDWSLGSPDPESLRPVRRPTSGAVSRHIPVRAFSTTTSDFVELESGLEHDLFRLLDRDGAVVWLVAQPLRLTWPVVGRKKARTHTPDLLSVDAGGRVTVWDVKRPQQATADDFAVDRAVTECACVEVGWGYEVFTGLGPVHQHNLMWLHSYRRQPAWAASCEPEVLAQAAGGCVLGELVTPDDPQRAAVVWHLIWAGRLRLDLTSRLTAQTAVAS
ncbi:TnsA-like heteromeric transposase endonuclease subunit [Nocardioides ultimimeridianus]